MRAAAGILAIDQGSHASRALVYDADGRVVARGEAAVDARHPRPGWVEHDADALLASVFDAVDAALAEPGVRSLAIEAAGLATQRSSIVCWDRATGQPLSPVLSWQDRRNAAWLAGLGLDPARVHALTGLVPSPHYGASKLRWCLDHLAPVRRAAADGTLACGPLASFLAARLLREQPCVVDPANASRTLLWDVRTGDWAPELLACFGISADWLPRCVPSRHEFGTLERGGRLLPLRVMTGDQAAALFAWGAPEPGVFYVNIGTGAFVQCLAAPGAVTPPGILRSVAWSAPGEHLQVLEGTVNGAGAALEWLAAMQGVPVQALLEVGQAIRAAPGGLPLFMNFVGGLGSPYWHPGGEPAFRNDVDRVAQSSPGVEAAAVLESIAFLLRVNIELMGAAARPAPAGTARVAVSGGLARVDALCRCLASLCGIPVLRRADVEATAQGLGWLLATRRDEVEPPACFEPEPDATLEQRFQRWRNELEAAIGWPA
jgi:glycerol kinase